MTRAPGLDWSQSISQRMSQIKTAVFIAALVPLAVMVYDGFTGGLGSNPVEEITHRTGEWGLRFLLLTLTITPLRRLMGINTLVRLRRMLGLYAFFYASLHFTTYVWLDAYFDLAYIVEDVVKRLYITVGFSAFVLLIPLALTSNDAMIRRLGGARWRLLHRLSYVAAIGGVLHFLWLVKADHREPLVYAAYLALVLLLRLPMVAQRLPKVRQALRRQSRSPDQSSAVS